VSVWASKRPTICNDTCGLSASSGMTFEFCALQGAQAECQQAEQTAGKQQAQLAQLLSAEAQLTARLRGLEQTQVSGILHHRLHEGEHQTAAFNARADHIDTS
jgi:cell division protein FtsB